MVVAPKVVNKKVKLVPIKVNIHARNASIFHTQIFSYHMQNHSDLCFCVHRISYIMLDIFMLKYYNNYIIIAFFMSHGRGCILARLCNIFLISPLFVVLVPVTNQLSQR
jgi:hypothetical protein